MTARFFLKLIRTAHRAGPGQVALFQLGESSTLASKKIRPDRRSPPSDRARCGSGDIHGWRFTPKPHQTFDCLNHPDAPVDGLHLQPAFMDIP